MSQYIKTEISGDIAHIGIARPEKHNAMSLEMWDALGAALTALDGNTDIRCIVLSGHGGRAFSAGADIGEFLQERQDPEAAHRYGERAGAALAAIRNCRHPVIAAIDGLCVGGGLELAALCDIRIASTASRFGLPVKRLGLTVALSELDPLVSLIGPGPILQLLLTGDLIDAEEAKRIGLVGIISDAENFEETVRTTAAKIAAGAPLVARWHKRFVHRLTEPRPITAEEHKESHACFATEDFQIGREAFLNKTQPQFKGR